MKSLARVLIAAALLPLLYLATHVTQFRHEVVMTYDGDKLSVTINNDKTTARVAQVELEAFTSLTFTGNESAYPNSASDIVINQPGKAPIVVPGFSEPWFEVSWERWANPFATASASANSAAEVPNATWANTVWAWVGGVLGLYDNTTQPDDSRLPALPRNNLTASGDWFTEEAQRDVPLIEEPISVSGPFELRATFTGRNIQGQNLYLRGESQELKVYWRRGYLNADWGMFVNNRHVGGSHLRGPVDMQAWNLVDFAVRGGMVACGLVILFNLASLLLTLAAGWLIPAIRRPLPGWLAIRRWMLVPLGLVCVAVLLTVQLCLHAWVADRVHDRTPHFQDDMCFLLRAKWLTAGSLYLPKPPYWANLPDPRNFEYSFFIGDRWVTQYPIGWSIALALGVMADAPWMVAPICAMVASLLLFVLGWRVYGLWTGVLAAFIALLSPMHALMGGSTLSHAFTALLLTAAVLAAVSLTRAKSWQVALLVGAVTGFCVGFCAGTRPLAAICAALPLAVFVLLELLRQGYPSRMIVGCLAGLGGGLVGVVPVLLDNYASTGDIFTFAYSVSPMRMSLSVGNLDNMRGGIWGSDHSLALTTVLATGWGFGWLGGWLMPALMFGLCLVPFVALRANRYDVLLLSLFVTVTVAHTFVNGSGIHGYGPRYLYDMYFCLFLLCARGFVILAELNPVRHRPSDSDTAAVADRSAIGNEMATASQEQADVMSTAADKARASLLPQVATLSMDRSPSRVPAALLPGSVFAALLLVVLVWPLWQQLPAWMLRYRFYNQVDNRIARAVEQTMAQNNYERLLLLVDMPPGLEWREWARMANVMPRHWADRVVAGAFLPSGGNDQILAAFPDRPVYVWRNESLSLMREPLFDPNRPKLAARPAPTAPPVTIIENDVADAPPPTPKPIAVAEVVTPLTELQKRTRRALFDTPENVSGPNMYTAVRGNGEGQFDSPRDVALLADGSVVVADCRNHRLQLFKADGSFVRAWGGEGNADGQMREPEGVCVGDDGHIYLLDTWNGRIQSFTVEGKHLASFPQKSELFGPRAMAMMGDNLLVSNTGRHRVDVFDRQTLAPLSQIGSQGSDEGQFDHPWGIAVAPNGHFYVVDGSTGHNRIQHFDDAGQLVRVFAVPGWEGEQFRESYADIDANGHLFVTDRINNTVLQFSAQGELLQRLELGSVSPTGIAVGKDFILISSDHRIHRLAKLPPPTTAD